MKLAILSQAPRCYSTRRLKEAALGRGHDVNVLDSTRFSLLLEHGSPNLLYRALPLERYDAVIPRIRASITFFGTQGAQGMGVILADSTKNAQAILETMRTARQNVLIQKFVAESKGRDVRALVVGDRVVAAVRRTAQGQEFRSNLHRGAKAEPVTLDCDYEATALRAAHIIGLDVAGVDMLEGKDGPQVTEVNSSPGLQGLELATRVDVAGAIVGFLEAQLTAHQDENTGANGFARDDYQMSEVSVARDSELVGQTVHGSGLQGRGLVVLKLRRDDREIVRPDETVVIMPGDLLLCFGRSAELQALTSEATGNGFH
jgi:ribosomal protein S6--L-glutamate ligase